MYVDVIIVNWNSGAQLSAAVLSIVEHGCSVSKVVVVDNSSSDDSIAILESVRDKCPFQLIVLKNDKNRGFGAACNQGALECDSPYILFLNPDARLKHGTLQTSMEFMEKIENSHIGICGVQLIEESGRVARSCSRFPSVKGFFAYTLGFDRLFPRMGILMTEWDHLNTQEVDQIIGACFLVRRSVFETLHGFDERFFVYFEEVDFSYRAHLLGWRSMYLADVQAFHAGGGTSRQIKARRLFYALRSRLLYVHKHFSRPAAVAVLLMTLILEPLSRSAFALARCSWLNLRETWVAYGLLWRWLPQWVFKGVTQ
ncbi:MAG: glycosyltransferase family 2 protein [Betaproteobacteria bacterium]|nr:glycosyltransferase family 2 protein [Betaproteobacteria bacterium]